MTPGATRVHLHRRANTGPGQRQRKRRLVLSACRDGLVRPANTVRRSKQQGGAQRRSPQLPTVQRPRGSSYNDVNGRPDPRFQPGTGRPSPTRRSGTIRNLGELRLFWTMRDVDALLVGAQRAQDDLADVLRAVRHHARPRLLTGLVAAAAELGCRDRRQYERHGDAVRLELSAADRREHVDGGLGGGVRADAGQRHPGRAGADVDDSTRALGAHSRQHGLGHGHEADHVELEHTGELVEIEPVEGRVQAHPGVVAQPVNPAVPVERRLNQPADGGGVGDVGRHGRIDGLVNNAGVSLHSPLDRLDLDEFARVLQLNVISLVAMTQAVLPAMRARGSGRIVNISSGTTRMALPGVGAYAATKAAVNMLTAVARRELEADGIAVSLVLPSITATEFGGGRYQPGEQPRPGMVAHSAEYVGQVVLRALRTGEERIDIPHGPEQPELTEMPYS